MTLPLGKYGAVAISALIMISALGAINGLLFCGIRLYSNFGQHERLFAFLSRRVGRVPAGALLVQTAFSLALIFMFETGGSWKKWLGEPHLVQKTTQNEFGVVMIKVEEAPPRLAKPLSYLNMGVPEGFTRKADGFDDVVACTAPVFWLFGCHCIRCSRSSSF
jgi:hypothetical protein